MISLDAIILRRAEEQVRAYRMDEPTTHDRWAVKPAQYVARKVDRSRPCLAGDCDRRVSHHGYCSMHWNRVLRGCPVDYTPREFETKRSRRQA